MPDDNKKVNSSDNTFNPPAQEKPPERLDIPETFPPPPVMGQGPVPESPENNAGTPLKIPDTKIPEQTTQPSTVLTKGSSSKFGFFAVLGIIIGLLVWGGVAYLYISNKNMNSTGNKTSQNTPATPTAEPTPSFSPDQIKVVNGSIIRDIPGSGQTTLIDKKDYKTTGITGFAKVVVSPDNSKMCFEAWPPAPAPSLYFSSIEGKNAVKIGENYKNCLWTADSINIFYINTAALGSPVDIYAYDTNRGQEKNITADSQKISSRAYEMVGFSGDASKLVCKYTLLEGSEKGSEKGCEITISGLTVKDTN